MSTLSRPLEVRRATLDDLSGVLHLERSVPEAPHWGERVYRDLLLQEPAAATLQRALFVATAEGQLAGFAVVAIVADEAELESVAVDPGLRRLGMGKALSEKGMLWAREAGARQMLLEVRSANAGARALYGRLGFQETGLRRGYYSNPADDAVLMSISLLAAADL